MMNIDFRMARLAGRMNNANNNYNELSDMVKLNLKKKNLTEQEKCFYKITKKINKKLNSYKMQNPKNGKKREKLLKHYKAMCDRYEKILDQKKSFDRSYYDKLDELYSDLLSNILK